MNLKVTNKQDLETDLYTTYKYGIYNKKDFFDENNKRLFMFIKSFILDQIDPVAGFRIFFLSLLVYVYKIPQEELAKYRSAIMEKISDIEEYIVKMHNLLVRMLDIALGYKLPSEEEAEKLESEIAEAIYYKKLYWRGGEFTGYIDSGNSYISMNIENGVGDVPILTLSSAKDAFRISIEALAKAFNEGKDKYGGYKAIGICKHCGKLFEKSRVSQIYCSEKCNNIVKQAKYRNEANKSKK